MFRSKFIPLLAFLTACQLPSNIYAIFYGTLSFFTPVFDQKQLSISRNAFYGSTDF